MVLLDHPPDHQEDPVLAPDTYSETDALVGYLDAQLDGLRTAAHGLTEEQARRTPCRSALSVGGLLKHATYVMRSRTEPGGGTDSPATPEAYSAFADSFALRDDETLDGTLAAFDETRAAYLDAVRAVDPGAVVDAPPAPWFGRTEPTPATERYSLLHHVEELARHAGHADILREEIDGADAGSLHLAAAGLPGNAFLQPWQPAG